MDHAVKELEDLCVGEVTKNYKIARIDVLNVGEKFKKLEAELKEVMKLYANTNKRADDMEIQFNAYKRRYQKLLAEMEERRAEIVRLRDELKYAKDVQEFAKMEKVKDALITQNLLEDNRDANDKIKTVQEEKLELAKTIERNQFHYFARERERAKYIQEKVDLEKTVLAKEKIIQEQVLDNQAKKEEIEDLRLAFNKGEQTDVYQRYAKQLLDKSNESNERGYLLAKNMELMLESASHRVHRQLKLLSQAVLTIYLCGEDPFLSDDPAMAMLVLIQQLFFEGCKEVRPHFYRNDEIDESQVKNFELQNLPIHELRTQWDLFAKKLVVLQDLFDGKNFKVNYTNLTIDYKGLECCIDELLTSWIQTSAEI